MASNDDLVGIRGWLLLPATALVIVQVVLLMGLVLLPASLHDWSLWHDWLLWFTIYSTYTSICFFRKQKEVPSLMIIWMAYSVIHAICEKIFLGNSSAVDSLVSVLVSLIFASIGIRYFLVSKRVLLTFVN